MELSEGSFGTGYNSVATGTITPRAASLWRTQMLFMVVEHFKNNDALPVYRRFRDRGRLAPEGVQYISSWVDDKLERCFQIMEAGERDLLDRWIDNWSDIVDFEVFL
jgi:Protein of unknown function (DUF3303)